MTHHTEIERVLSEAQQDCMHAMPPVPYLIMLLWQNGHLSPQPCSSDQKLEDFLTAQWNQILNEMFKHI